MMGLRCPGARRPDTGRWQACCLWAPAFVPRMVPLPGIAPTWWQYPGKRLFFCALVRALAILFYNSCGRASDRPYFRRTIMIAESWRRVSVALSFPCLLVLGTGAVLRGG